MASFKMKNQVCVYIFHESLGSDVLTFPTGLAGRAFRKISGELGPKPGVSQPFWERHMAALPSISPTEGGPDSLTHTPWVGGRTLLGLFPEPAALKQESTLKRPMFE